MHISFHGAAQIVTGSKHIITLKNGKKLLLDCGLFQGQGSQTDTLNRFWGFVPSEIDYMVLSHAHIDHTGLIPKLVLDGYKGKIFCTPATFEVTSILLRDSARIQEADIRFVNKKRRAMHLPPFEPLYTEEDAERSLSRFVTHPYNQPFTIDEDIEVLFKDAGHILGSATVSLSIKESGKTQRVLFTGDLGRYNNRILCSPENAPQAEVIICESTYGTKLHDNTDFSENELLTVIENTIVKKKGKLIIPAFSVGRTQEVLYVLNQLEETGRLPKVDVFVDSPLSTEATNIVRAYPELYNKKIKAFMETDADPFDFDGLQFVANKVDSQDLNYRETPCVIISASGMAEAGRVKHHIAHGIGDPKNTILMVGYAEPNSLGGRLQSGVKTVKIFGEEYIVRADVVVLHSFSAHGDYEDICQFLSNQDPKLVEKFFVVHGEPEVQHEFAERMRKKGFAEVYVPQMHEGFHC